MKLRYFKELDGVRGVAALMVMLFHFCQALQPDNASISKIQTIAKFGQTGVSLFFVLSGFLITRILLSSKNDNKFFVNFFIRRSLRIFPLYFGFLAITYFFIPYLTNTDSPSFAEQAYYWFYLQDFAATFNWNAAGPFHFWSLAIEEHFYLFWPFVVYWCNIRQLKVVVLLIVISAFLVRILLNSNHFEVFYFTFSRIDEIAIGSLLAVFEFEKRFTIKSPRYFLFTFVAIIVPTMFIWLSLNQSGNPILQVTKFLMISGSYLCILGYTITSQKTNWLNQILKIKPLLFTGKVSYGLYIFHPVCFALFSSLVGTSSILLNLAGGLITTYLISAASFYFFESRFLLLKNRYSAREVTNNHLAVEQLQPFHNDKLPVSN